MYVCRATVLCVFRCNTAPLCLHREKLRFQHTPVSLIPSKVSLSKTVTQSLPCSLSLSIRQSAVSRSLIQSVPRLLGLSVSCSFSHSIPLAWFAHLTSPSFTHLHFPPIHHSTHLFARFLTVNNRPVCQRFSLAGKLLTLWKLPVFSMLHHAAVAPCTSNPLSLILFDLKQFISFLPLVPGPTTVSLSSFICLCRCNRLLVLAQNQNRRHDPE